jgi:hypothetical protein
MLDVLPHRGDGATRPAGLPLPPGRMPLLRGGRPLKRWRYVGVYGPEALACFGVVRIAALPQVFWAVWDRERRGLSERTGFRRGGIVVDHGRVHVPGVAELVLEATGEAVEVVSRHGAEYIWTRKQPARARGSLIAGGRTIAVDAAALIDDSAGYHARETAWDWCAGVGTAVDGTALAWNLVTGVHDAPRDSERTVWAAGAPREVGPVRFAADLSAIAFAEDGAALDFRAEAQRARRDDLKVFVSDYRQPFGTFTGELPGGLALAEGFGVMERHAVRW